MMRILIMGYSGFIGTNLMRRLKTLDENIEYYLFNSKSNEVDLDRYTKDCDFAFNFSAIHRPQMAAEFYDINYGLTQKLIQALESNKNYCPILYTSSIQAVDDTDYGKSKTMAENLVIQYSRTFGVPVYIYRLTNTFGPGARPNGHSVVATFCNNIQNGMEINISDRNRIMHFYYIDDVIESFTNNLFTTDRTNEQYFYSLPRSSIYDILLGTLADKLIYFKKCRDELLEPALVDPIDQPLLATFDSYKGGLT